MIKRLIFLTTIIFLYFASRGYSQCKDDSGVFKCATLLSDSVVYLNDFNLSKKMKSAEDNGEQWEIYLIQGNRYQFALCCYEGLDKVEMKLYNSSNPESNPIGTTYIDGKDNAAFYFKCLKSDVYYVSIRIKPGLPVAGERTCAIGLLGYAGKFK